MIDYDLQRFYSELDPQASSIYADFEVFSQRLKRCLPITRSYSHEIDKKEKGPSGIKN